MTGEPPLNSGGRNGAGLSEGSSPEVAARVGRIVEHFGRRRVASVIGVSPETVRRYETGATPNARFLNGVCDGLGVSAEWIVLGTGPLLESERRREMVSRASLPESLGELMRRVLEPRSEKPANGSHAGRNLPVKRAGVRWESAVESAANGRGAGLR